MAAPDSGLEIRDRMWLKITIPNAFIGEFYAKIVENTLKTMLYVILIFCFDILQNAETKIYVFDEFLLVLKIVKPI